MQGEAVRKEVHAVLLDCVTASHALLAARALATQQPRSVRPLAPHQPPAQQPASSRSPIPALPSRGGAHASLHHNSRRGRGKGRQARLGRALVAQQPPQGNWSPEPMQGRLGGVGVKGQDKAVHSVIAGVWPVNAARCAGWSYCAMDMSH